jgi:hypothetical protein
MTGDPNTDQSPHSPSDDERLAALRAHSPRAALMDRLDLLEGGIPGAAAYQAALRLLPKNAPPAGAKPPAGARWNRAEGAWEVDHAAAMRLWDPPGGVGLPPREMVDAFLTGYAERTGDDGERRLVEELYAEAEQRLADQGGVAESFPETTRAEAAAVAERYGYGELVETITLGGSPGTLGLALTLAVVPAFLGALLLFRSDGDMLPLVGGIALLAVAAAALAWGLVSQRKPRRAPKLLFVFTDGVVFGVNGLLDPYAWRDLELHDASVSSTVGLNPRELRTDLLMIGPRGRSMQFVVPSEYRNTVADLGRAGGAAFG